MCMELIINWETGGMILNCNKFFPTTKKKMSKLLKVIRLDWQNQDEILKHLVNLLNDFEKESETKMQEIQKQFGNEYQRMKDFKELLSSCKWSNGVPLTYSEIKQTEQDLVKQKRLLQRMERNFKHYSVSAKRLRANLEMAAEVLDSLSKDV